MAVVDLRLPDMSGLDVVRELKAIDPATAVVVLTGYGSIATALEAIRLGAVHYLTKPTDADRVLEAFEHGLAARPRELALDTPSLARVEWEHIQRVLADCGGNISEAARTLSMPVAAAQAGEVPCATLKTPPACGNLSPDGGVRGLP
jgi:two-component system response regulator RegA